MARSHPLGTLRCLPREVRDEIYGHLSPESYVLKWILPEHGIYTWKGAIPIMLQLSKIINIEAQEQLYARSQAIYDYQPSSIVGRSPGDWKNIMELYGKMEKSLEADKVREEIFEVLRPKAFFIEELMKAAHSRFLLRESLIMRIKINFNLYQFVNSETSTHEFSQEIDDEGSKFALLTRWQEDETLRKEFHIEFTGCMTRHRIEQIPHFPNFEAFRHVTYFKTVIFEVRSAEKRSYPYRGDLHVFFLTESEMMKKSMVSIRSRLEEDLGPAETVNSLPIPHPWPRPAGLVDKPPLFFSRRLEFHPYEYFEANNDSTTEDGDEQEQTASESKEISVD